MPDGLEADDDAVEQNVAGAGDLAIVLHQLALLQSHAALTTALRAQPERKQLRRSCALNASHKSLIPSTTNVKTVREIYLITYDLFVRCLASI